MSNLIQVVVDRVSVVTINRVERMNALNVDMLHELDAAYRMLDADDSVRVVVLTGAGEKAFMAGGDIDDLGSRTGLVHYVEFAEVVHDVYRRIEALSKPTIAAVNGFALGGGVEIMLAHDLRVLSDRSILGLPEITMGLFPGAGGTQRLTRQIALCRAKELLFSGDRFTAQQALEWGLVNRVVAHDDLMTEVMDLAGRVAKHPPLTVRLLKRTINEGLQMTLPAALSYEQAMIGLTLDSEDAHEGLSAFSERRPARFASDGDA